MLEIAVCDDNRKELKHVASVLQDIFSKKKIYFKLKLFTAVDELITYKGKNDIVILDIEMGDQNGIDIGCRLRKKNPDINLIYITSCEQYIMQAVNDAHAYAYLTKPINDEVLRHQIVELITRFQDKMLEQEFHNVTDRNNNLHTSIILNLRDVLYFEYIKGQRKVAIVLLDEIYEYDCTFESIVDDFAQYDFAVNCRGILVNLRRIDTIKGYAVYLDNGMKLPVSQRRIEELRDAFDDYKKRYD